ncbi:MAG: acyl-CoA thioesterase [Chloroflexi bacterium]|nr:acyl-CoA thioesterase [Chloroflexota bacterium]MCI0578038.1 acyl-CoA thioesterase [Chloroflexota bacterium]MCI0644748.1 acyl-CoA thioesterase [Chloroflexota bacterium]MCI0728653.1 acyl-CoA thioesterase [Chloroflexota bacterium]
MLPIDAFPFHETVEVVFRDLDVMGHVNNAVYFTYMETTRTRFFARLLNLAHPKELPVILAEATCAFKSAAHFGERLRIGLGVSRLGGKSFDLVYQIEAEGGRLVALGKTVMVTYDYERDQTIPIPDSLRLLLKANLVEGVDG